MNWYVSPQVTLQNTPRMITPKLQKPSMMEFVREKRCPTCRQTSRNLRNLEAHVLSKKVGHPQPDEFFQALKLALDLNSFRQIPKRIKEQIRAEQ